MEQAPDARVKFSPKDRAAFLLRAQTAFGIAYHSIDDDAPEWLRRTVRRSYNAIAKWARDEKVPDATIPAPMSGKGINEYDEGERVPFDEAIRRAREQEGSRIAIMPLTPGPGKTRAIAGVALRGMRRVVEYLKRKPLGVGQTLRTAAALSLYAYLGYKFAGPLSKVIGEVERNIIAPLLPVILIVAAVLIFGKRQSAAER